MLAVNDPAQHAPPRVDHQLIAEMVTRGARVTISAMS